MKFELFTKILNVIYVVIVEEKLLQNIRKSFLSN